LVEPPRRSADGRPARSRVTPPGHRRYEFGLDVFGLDDRMRLFGYVTADNRLAYLWVLRAFDAARANYHVLLHTSEVTTALAGLHGVHPDCPDPAELDLARLLDALVDWGVLDRSQDGTRATTLAEYRNRHSVYQFTEAGYRAHRAVESVLSATMDDTTLPGHGRAARPPADQFVPERGGACDLIRCATGDRGRSCVIDDGSPRAKRLVRMLSTVRHRRPTNLDRSRTRS
jgi:Protein of unknown function (DUF2397)